MIPAFRPGAMVARPRLYHEVEMSDGRHVYAFDLSPASGDLTACEWIPPGYFNPHGE